MQLIRANIIGGVKKAHKRALLGCLNQIWRRIATLKGAGLAADYNFRNVKKEDRVRYGHQVLHEGLHSSRSPIGKAVPPQNQAGEEGWELPLLVSVHLPLWKC